MAKQIIPRSTKIILLVALVLVCYTPHASSALVAHEPFDYTAGAAIHDQSGGTFDGAWVDNHYWVPAYTASDGGLTYPGLPSSGNAALTETEGSDARLQRPIGQLWTTIPYTTGVDEAWVSFLLQINDNTPRTDEYAGLYLQGGSAGHAFVGMSDMRHIGLRVVNHPYGTGTSEVGFDDDPVTVGQTYLLVARIIFNGLAGDSIDLWIDPEIGQPLGDPSDSHQDALLNLGYIRYGAAYMDGGALVDEIRVGDTMADVLPAVPVPAALWLFGSGLIGLACARRKS